MYVVVRAFIDSKNKDHLYEVGDVYPASGHKTTKARIAELVQGTNKNGRVYLEEVENEKQDDGSEDEQDDGSEQ